MIFRQLLTFILIVSSLNLMAAAATKPNIVVILADDLGFGDVQVNNPQRGKIPTPNIDRIAIQGMRFTDGHSSSGVCSPSRYALLTGRYHWRTRLQQGIVGVWGAPLIAPDRLTIASLAKKQGYRTACIGKWHLGRDWPISDQEKPFFQGFGPNFQGITPDHVKTWSIVFNRPIPGGPTTRGFDHYFGTDVPNWPPYCFIQDDRTIGIPSELLPESKFVKNQASLRGPALPGWNFEPILPRLADEACEFIAESSANNQNYLLYLPLTTPHTPLAVNPEWKGKSGLDNAAADLIMETDAAVGRVLEAVQKTGNADNTLVIFTADNGFAPYVGAKDLEARGHFPSGPLRGYKGDVYEGGHRVPYIIRWPVVVKPGTVSGQLVHHADLIATLAEIFGEKLPDNAGEDSFSILPLLRGEDRPVRETAVSTANAGIPGFRQGAWKLILAADPVSKTEVQLYNLADDLAENKNLAATHPERVRAMRARFEKIITDGRSTPGPGQKNDVRVNRYPRQPDPTKKKQATARNVSLKSDTPSPGSKQDRVGPWNLAELKKTPGFHWLSQQGPIHSLLYRGEPYKGKETEVFAFYASPATLRKAKSGERFPGVVLIHGGGGTAFAEWVWLWANRGYAAIAMDLSGNRSIDPVYNEKGEPVPNQAARPDKRMKLTNGGPDQGHPEKFQSIGGEFSDDWPFHAAASVIKAHSLLLSFPDVNPDLTAVTGISWGGYTTCLVASLDDRFKAAVPVYGCGYLFEGESVQKPAIDQLGDRRQAWISNYDPSSLLGRCRVPVLFVNGTNDIHYPMDSYQKSFDLVPGFKQMRMQVNMPHGHPPGWRPEEIGLFIDSFCRDGKPLPVPGAISIDGDLIKLQVQSSQPIKSAELHYTTDTGLRSARKWITVAANIEASQITAPIPPPSANTWFLTISDNRGAMVSTPIQFKK